MSTVRTLTVDDDLALSRRGYERGEVLVPDERSTVAHRYRVDTASSLVVDGLVLLETTAAGFRFLDTTHVPLTVRDLRRFRILLKVADGHPTQPTAGPAAPAWTPVSDGPGPSSSPWPGSVGAGPADAPGEAAAPPDAAPELADLRDDALDNELLDGVDFAVVGVGAPAGEECIVFEAAADGFVVSYRDGGVAQTLFSARSMAQARAVFLDEACWLGAERGRGTYVGRSQAVGTEDWTPAQVVAAYERRLLGDG